MANWETSDDNMICKLIGDSRRVTRILINLVKNSIKYTGKNGKIQIDARYFIEQKELQISVQDSGLGISKEDLPHVFTRFGKLKRTAA